MWRLIECKFFCFLVLLGLCPGTSFAANSLSGMDVVTGQPVTFDLEASNSGSVIVFLSAKCPCSMSHEASLRELSQRYQKLGMRFIGVHSNADEPVVETSRHFKELHLPFPVIQDNSALLANQWGAMKTPHVFVVFHGKTVYQGGVDDSHQALDAKSFYLAEALKAVLAGETPPVQQTRTLGCAIKRL